MKAAKFGILNAAAPGPLAIIEVSINDAGDRGAVEQVTNISQRAISA